MLWTTVLVLQRMLDFATLAVFVETGSAQILRHSVVHLLPLAIPCMTVDHMGNIDIVSFWCR